MEQCNLLHFFLISIFLLVGSCSDATTKNKIFLPNGKSFLLKDGEEIKEINQKNIDFYELYFNTDLSNQIPLYKFIKHNQYEIYIGFPIGKDISNKFHQKIKLLNNKNYILEMDSLNNSIRYKLENKYFTEYLYTSDKKNYFIFTFSEIDSISNILFNSTIMLNRFIN